MKLRILVELSSNDIFGPGEPTWVIEQIGSMLEKFEIDLNLLSQMSYRDIEYAHMFFQLDLDRFPEMYRFRIVDGLMAYKLEGKPPVE